MSNLFYSQAPIGDIYTNDTSLTNDSIFTINDSNISINCSDQVIFNNNTSHNINNIKNDLLEELMNSLFGDFPLDPEISNFIQSASNVIDKYKTEQKKMIEYEKIYQTELNNTNDSIKSLESYSNIAVKLEDENINLEETNKNIPSKKIIFIC